MVSIELARFYTHLIDITEASVVSVAWLAVLVKLLPADMMALISAIQ